MPLLTAKGDFKKATKLLFYTDRTKGYRGEKIKGVDRIIKDVALDAMFRIYEPDEAKMKTWKVPQFEMLSAASSN